MVYIYIKKIMEKKEEDKTKHTCTHAHTHTHTHTKNDSSRNWVLILVGAEIP